MSSLSKIMQDCLSDKRINFVLEKTALLVGGWLGVRSVVLIASSRITASVVTVAFAHDFYILGKSIKLKNQKFNVGDFKSDISEHAIVFSSVLKAYSFFCSVVSSSGY